MQSIIKELYYGNIRPFERQFDKDSDYARALHTAGECDEKLRAILGEEGLRLYENFRKANCAVTTEEEADAFIVGFRLGARFIFDVFMRDESGFRPIKNKNGDTRS